MTRKVNALQVRKNLGELINEVFYRQERFLIERHGTPVAAIVPVRELEELERREARLLALIEDEMSKAPGAPAEAIEKRVKERLGIETGGEVLKAITAASRRKRLAVFERVKEATKDVPEEEIDQAIEEAIAAVRSR